VYRFTVLGKNLKPMKEEMLEQFRFSNELKEKLIFLIVYKNQSPKSIAKQYGLPNVHMLINWVRIYKIPLKPEL
jgi:transposase-like protein